MELHKYQSEILKKLMYNPKLRFSDLLIPELTSKHFNYHLKELVSMGLIEKGEGGYLLTNKGKMFVTVVDEKNMNVEKQPKVSVALIIERTKSDGSLEYLVNKQTKNPYYGKVGGLTGKVRFGERFEDTARRELLEETGLIANEFKLAKIIRKIAYKEENEQNCVLQDQLMVIFLVRGVSGDLVEKIDDQVNFWCDYDELVKRDDLHNTFLQVLDIARTRKVESDIEVVVEAEGF